MTGVGQKYSCFLLFIAFLICYSSFGQMYGRKSKKVDTVYAKVGEYVILPDSDFLALNDTFFISRPRYRVKVKANPYAKSDAFYDSLESRSYRNRVSKELYGLLFRNQATTVSDSSNVIKSVRVFRPFEGDLIRKITIKKVDVLEGSVYDTTVIAVTGLGKAINKLHTTTKNRIILENLLFEAGDKVDPYKLADNERILRQLPFIDDALIEVVPDLNQADTVDVTVITQDLMALGLDGSFSSFTDWRIALFNQNFLGRGDELYVQYRTDDKENPESGGLVRFRTQNIRGSFINAEIKYQDDFIENSLIFDFQREFVTPETKYAGGITFGDLKSWADGRTANDTVSKREKLIEFRKGFYDVWLGRSFQLNKKNERQNLIVAGRLLREDYSTRPPTDETQNLAFQDKYLIIGSISYTQRNFLKSNMIFNFYRTEDVPTGFLFSGTFGFERGEFKSRPYTSVEAGFAEYYEKLGYFAIGAGVGGFIDDGELEQGNFVVRGLYYTPLLRLGRTRIRNFLSYNYQRGFKRDSIDLVNLRGFTRGTNGGKFRGDERLAFNFESNFFTPVYFYGFRMVLFPFVDFGWLGFRENLFRSDNFYYGLGMGVRFRNESFILRTISLSLSYYPQIVEESANFDVNISASDPRLFRRFVAVKPDLLRYR